jgi:NAD(P)-dependent dehydrogenase (short-subunit alcohol dehydrogenase family)
MQVLKDRVAIVTGGASGLGEATVRLFHEEGARVVIADVAEDLGRALAEELGERVVFRRCDVSLESEVEALVQDAAAELGQLDIMFNNAGISDPPVSVLDLAVEDFDRAIGVDLRGVFLGIKHAGRVMKTRGRGSIINTASASAHFAGGSPYAYTAAKAGVIQLTRQAALELGEFGIRVNSISPGMFFTRIYWGQVPEEQREAMRGFFAKGTAAWNPLHRMGEPIEVARAALWLASDESSYVNAEDIVVDGGSVRGVRRSNTWFGKLDRGESILE